MNLSLPGCWFQIFFVFTPTWGNDSHFDKHIFQRGWFNHQPVPNNTFQVIILETERGLQGKNSPNLPTSKGASVPSSAASSAVTAVTALEVPTVTVEPAVETTAETPRFLVFGANTAGVAAGAAVDFRHPKKAWKQQIPH